MLICITLMIFWFKVFVNFLSYTTLIKKLKLWQNKQGQRLLGCTVFESFFWIFISCLLLKKNQKWCIPTNVWLFLFWQSFSSSIITALHNYFWLFLCESLNFLLFLFFFMVDCSALVSEIYKTNDRKGSDQCDHSLKKTLLSFLGRAYW